MEKKIMLVDDAAFMRMTIKNVLTKMGYTNLLEAADGAQAVEMYEKEHPDLVIMDITMPNMDGIQALQAIKAKDPGAKVIMCSAMGQEAMVVQAIKEGALSSSRSSRTVSCRLSPRSWADPVNADEFR